MTPLCPRCRRRVLETRDGHPYCPRCDSPGKDR